MWSYFVESPSSLSSKNLRESGKHIPSVLTRIHQFTFALTFRFVNVLASLILSPFSFCLHFCSVPIFVLSQFSFCPHSFCLLPFSLFPRPVNQNHFLPAIARRFRYAKSGACGWTVCRTQDFPQLHLVIWLEKSLHSVKGRSQKYTGRQRAAVQIWSRGHFSGAIISR